MTVVVPQTTLDLESILCDKLELKPKQVEAKFDFEQQDDKLILKVHRDSRGKAVWLERGMWKVVTDYVATLKGAWFSQDRTWEIPLETDSKPAYKEPRNEVQPSPKLPATYKEIPSEKMQSNNSIEMPPESVGTMRLDDLRASVSQVGQIYPVIKDQTGRILDGFHRKRLDPDWKETIVEVADPLHALRIRIHANVLRRDLPWKEKHEWIQKARRFLNPSQPEEVTYRELKEALGMSEGWIAKYDRQPYSQREYVDWKERFLGYNIWGFKNDDWHKFIAPAPPDMPDKEFYHGTTPPWVIHQLIKMFQPKIILDSMAGIGTTGYVCKQYEEIEYDLFDIYPYPKYAVQQGDAEFIDTGKKYDLIFNHIPYRSMTKYGDDPNDLSNLTDNEFYVKMRKIFNRNFELLNPNGIYAILVGDWRHGGQILSITANITKLGLETGFKLYDEAVTLSGETKGKTLKEYRATKHGYLAQGFDTVLIFRKD